jgi:hypothetical protein
VSFASQPDRASAVAETAHGAAQLFDLLLLTSSVLAFVLAAIVGVLLLVVVARMANGGDARGLGFLMVACGLGAVALGLVAYESGPWSTAWSAYAAAAPEARAALVGATSDAMRPFATGAILVSMAIPVTLVPATNRVRIAIAAVAIVVLGVAAFTSVAAYQAKARVESAS